MHHAVFRILYPIFDKTFIFDSYSCRINKGIHRAINRLNKFFRKASQNNTKICYVLKCDIKKFFDSIDHAILMDLVKQKIKDKNAIWLINKIIESYSIKTGKGIPLGNITSQLFANIYLNELDQFIKHKLKVKYYIRYCDDFVILDKDKFYLQKLISLINNFLANELKLVLHPNKVMIRKYRQGIDFLGYVCFPYDRILRLKTKKRMFRKIKRKLVILNVGEIAKEHFNHMMQSYYGVLRHCNSHKLNKILNKFILVI